MRSLKTALKIPVVCNYFKVKPDYRTEFKFKGLKFDNRIGLAAGFDKNAEYLHELKELGFGHVEIGTVTPLAQDGNPKPRLFRLKKDEAIINRMGFNNDGMAAISKRLKKRPEGLIVGGNIGKNKVTENEDAHLDYLKCFETLYDDVDYFTVNVSSPNTPGLRELQGKDDLLKILSGLIESRKTKAKRKPIFLKIAPDLENEQIKEAVEVVNEVDVDGIVVNNTTISRDDLLTPKAEIKKIGNGGLSGKPLTQRANEVCIFVKQHLDQDKLLIGVGGIMNRLDALERRNAGADLVQVYTGFIYRGTKLIKECNDV